MKRRYYFRIVISLLILSTAPVVLVSTVLYNRFTERFIGYLSTTNELSLSQVSQSVDMVMDYLEAIAQVYGFDADIAYFAVNHFLVDPARFNNLQRKLANLYHATPLLDSVYVIFDRWDYLIYAGASLTERTTDLTRPVQGFYRFAELDGHDWFRVYAANVEPNRRLVPFAVENETFVSLVVPLTDVLLNVRGSFVLNVRSRDLAQFTRGTVSNLTIAYGDLILSSCFGSTVVNGIGDREFAGDLAYRLAAEPHNVTDEVTLSGRKFIVTELFSQSDSRWRFFSHIPVEEFFLEINLIRNATLISGTTIVAVCMVFALVIGRRIYSPIGRITRSIMGNRTTAGDDEDEIQFIGVALADMDRVKRNMDLYVRANMEVFRNTFLLDLVRDHFRDSADIASRMAFFEIRFPYQTFYVVLVAVDQISGDEGTTATEYDRSAWKAQILAASQSVAEQIGVVARAFEALSSWICVLVNIPETEGDTHDMVPNYVERLRSMISRSLPFTVSIGVSSPASGYVNIGAAYRSAATALQRRFIAGRNCVLYANTELCDPSLDSSPVPDTGRIAHSVITADWEATRDLLQKFFLRLHQLPPERHAYAKNTIGLLVAGVLNDLSGLDKQTGSPIMETDLWHQLQSKTTLEDAQEWITNLLCALSDGIRRVRSNGATNAKVVMVEQFIRENFRRDISLVDMAEHARLNPAYLSQLFKGETGKNISGYLNQLRVQESKRLLFDVTLTVTDVACAVGYNNAQSYTRFFKKYEGCPPDEYRKRVTSLQSSRDAGSSRLPPAEDLSVDL